MINKFNPFFSVIIPTYFRQQLCIDAIQSILNQNFKNFEIIVVCHGKKNYIKFLKNNFSNHKFSYVYTKDKYLSYARNIGSDIAKGQWLVFLDDDDIWAKNKLKLFYNIISKKKNLDIVYSNFKTYNLINKKFENKQSLTLYNKNYSSLKLALQFSNYVSGGSAAAIRRIRFEQLGGFDNNLGGCEDHDLWRRAANNNYVFYFIDKPLTIYRKGNQNLSKNINNQVKFEKIHFEKLKNEIPYYYSHMYYDIEVYNIVRFAYSFLKNRNFTFFYIFFKANFFSKIKFCLIIYDLLLKFIKKKINDNC